MTGEQDEREFEETWEINKDGLARHPGDKFIAKWHWFASRRALMVWKSIYDELPPNGEVVLWFDTGTGNYTINTVAYAERHTYKWWMPLPKFPDPLTERRR